jgi:hypothetical protein
MLAAKFSNAMLLCRYTNSTFHSGAFLLCCSYARPRSFWRSERCAWPARAGSGGDLPPGPLSVNGPTFIVRLSSDAARRLDGRRQFSCFKLQAALERRVRLTPATHSCHGHEYSV